jgi:hypothetical protein
MACREWRDGVFKVSELKRMAKSFEASGKLGAIT